MPTDFSIEEGYQCARLCGLNILAQVKAACGGDLSKVKKVVKLVGFVNCPPDFYDIPKVLLYQKPGAANPLSFCMRLSSLVVHL